MMPREKFYSGKLVRCRNEDLLKYPPTPWKKRRLKRDLQGLVEKAGFGVVNIHIDDYDKKKKIKKSGPGITVVLKESHFLIGAWPEKRKSVTFLIYFCERGGKNNNKKAKRLAGILFKFSGAEKMVIDTINRRGPRLLHRI